jgi:hypothetical protein
MQALTARRTWQDQVANMVPLTKQLLTDAVDVVRGAVMMCYPMGLPEWDLVRLCLEDKEGTSVSATPAVHTMLPGSPSRQLTAAVRQRRAGPRLSDAVVCWQADAAREAAERLPRQERQVESDREAAEEGAGCPRKGTCTLLSHRKG